jgi:Alpha/beta hydrolase of unknown function (DUF900)
MLRVFLSAIIILITNGVKGSAADPPSCPPSELWEVSTRHLSCSICALKSPPDFQVYRGLNGSWLKSSVDELLGPSVSTESPPLTIVYVHGNWMERCNALERVRIVDGHIKRNASEPYRLIMFSWPSQHESRIIREVREHADCADVQSFYLAWLIQSLHASSSRISILGFSFGARSVAGALHLEAGGQIQGRLALANGLSSSDSSSERVCQHGIHRVSFVAPAIDRTWFSPNGRYSLAMTQIDHLVNLYNSKDPILRRFRFIDSVARPIAAGFTGLEAASNPPATSPLQGQDKIEQFDCRSAIGSTHSEVSYYSECPYFRAAINNLLWK